LNGKELIYGAEIDGIRRNKRIDETVSTKDEILEILNDPSTTTIIEIKSVPEKCVLRKLDDEHVKLVVFVDYFSLSVNSQSSTRNLKKIFSYLQPVIKILHAVPANGM
jgi:hypothetical protein